MTPYEIRACRRILRWRLKGYPSERTVRPFAMMLLFSLEEAARADPVLGEYVRAVLGAILDGKNLPAPQGARGGDSPPACSSPD